MKFNKLNPPTQGTTYHYGFLLYICSPQAPDSGPGHAVQFCEGLATLYYVQVHTVLYILYPVLLSTDTYTIAQIGTIAYRMYYQFNEWSCKQSQLIVYLLMVLGPWVDPNCTKGE